MARQLFLLGGHDLEMREIRKLLEECGCKPYKKGAEGDCFYADRNLSWGAKLSDYKDLLDFDGDIYGIELTEDIQTPYNYRAIDHHNQYWCRPSALEQAAERLGIKLTRWQRLVAANDRGHIAALKAMGATLKEIEKVREADMKAQGVTPQEQEQARREALAIQKKGKFYYKETELKHTTPLVDRLIKAGKTPLIIVNKTQKSLTYYGDGILKLAETFRKAVEAQKAYYGGNPPGYFGLTPEYFKDHSMEETLETIRQTLQTDPIHSYHIFMFPFRIKDFAQRNFITEKSEHERLLADGWESRPFAIETPQDYNEFVYFHKYVRDELYPQEAFDPDQTSRYYERKELDGAAWTMTVKGESFKLDLDGVALRLFRTGIGILTVNLINRQTDDNEKILLLNEFGRRIYPQFLDNPVEDDFAYKTKEAFLPQSVTITLADGKLLVEEDFLYTKLPSSEEAPKIGAHIRRLLGDTLADLADPVIDDRMYTLGYINKDGRSLGLDQKGYLNEECPSDFWYRYIFLDGSEITCHSPDMKKELLKKATYDRWMNNPWGCSLYGVTRYSFMLYSSYELLHTHVRTMYYQMAVLVLAQRASILRYADEVTELLKKGRDGLDLARCAALYYDYIDFINRLHFREVTPQEQGIELYDMMQRQMRIERELRELDGEIAELHSYTQMRHEEKQNEQAMTLNKIAAVFLPPTLLAGFFGMNIIAFPDSTPWALVAVFLLILSAFLGYKAIEAEKKKSNITQSIKDLFRNCRRNKPKEYAKCLLLSLLTVAMLGFALVSSYNTDDSTCCCHPTTKDANATKK